jgi:hypothetical protein
MARITLCTFSSASFFTLKDREVLKHRRNTKCRRAKVTVAKGKIGRERPHFFGFQPPKKFIGSLPP